MSDCRCTKRCRRCSGKHHTLIHRDSSSADSSAVNAGSSTSSSAPSQTSALTVSNSTFALTHFSDCSQPVAHSAVLLATAQLFIVTANGHTVRARALLDQGSELSFVRESLAQYLPLRRGRACIPIHGIGAQRACTTRGKLSLRIRSCVDPAAEYDVEAFILPQLTGQLPADHIHASAWSHLHNLQLADPDFAVPGRIDLILEADIYGALIRDSVIRGARGAPIAQATSLGWIVSGPIAQATAVPRVVSALASSVSSDNELHQLVTRFWQLEDVPATQSTGLSLDDQQCEAHFLATHSRDSSGRFTVRLPFRSSPPTLGESFASAASMLRRVQRRLHADGAFGQLYRDFMAEYESLGHMKLASPHSSIPHPVNFLPHHGVLRQSSTTTKLRVVFNGSMPTSSGATLNQCLLAGPKLQLDLSNLILSWRRYRFVFAADIEKMYRQINLHEEDRDHQRILWSESEHPREYQLCTVTYGLASAPYLALRVLRQLASDEEDRYPLAAQIIRHETYVDDVLSGADTLNLAHEKVSDIDHLLTAGGFRLQKWIANDPRVLTSISPDRHSRLDAHTFEDQSSARTLGISWHPARDAFLFEVNPQRTNFPVTKRNILSRIAAIFDPLGWLAPITVRAKVFIQTMWNAHLEWDEPLPPALAQEWAQLNSDLNDFTKFEIPRWLGISSSTPPLDIHGFADASNAAMGAVLYLRLSGGSSSSQVALLAAKSKVAPLKRQTIPRLELCAAVLLVRLVINVRDALKLSHIPVHLWTDSSVTLAWISGAPTRWKDFVANRVAFIQDSVPDAHWHHVPGEHNPADCASRGVTPLQLSHHSLWWGGPSWLHCLDSTWPSLTPPIEADVDMQQRRIKVTVATAAVDSVWDLVERYSSLRRLHRVTAWIRRSVSAMRGSPISGPLSSDEILAAETLWVQLTQQSYFAAEIQTLRANRNLSRSNPLRKLTPFLDTSGILRVGGRLQHSILDSDAQHPRILPRDSALTRLIIDDAHRRTLHGGTQLTLATLRRSVWILGGRAPVQSHIRRCVKCARYRAAAAQQMMGQLPSPNVTRHRPFINSGVDYAGPFLLRTWRGRAARTYKGFLIVFICFATSAVHLELATDYSTQGFLAAFRRFVGRRGSCRSLRSDCGTIVGADAELRRLFTAASKDWQQLSCLLASDGTTWRFNPPSAPHFGGKWEAAVKSVKFHLKRIIGDTLLTYEEFSTILVDVEAVLNSRPLCPLSSDPSDLEALTPGHFLIGEPLVTIPEPSLDAENPHRLSRHQLLRQCLDRFWRRWSSEYLNQLQEIHKWQDSSKAIRVGTLVLVRDERYPPSKWPLARVISIHPGADGLVRVVTVRTAVSTLKRSIVKLCPLPVLSEAEDAR